MATYYVRSSGGDNGNDGLSFANAWATLQYAADNASSAGDIVLVCADGTHLPTATVDFDTNAGSITNPIIFRGAAADGTDDETVAVISGASLPASADLFDLNISNLAVCFQNLRLTAGKQYNVDITGNVNAALIAFCNCRIDSAASHGVYQQENSINYLMMFRTEVDSNGGWGVAYSSNSRQGFQMSGCSIHDNTSGGVQYGGATTTRVGFFEKNLVYDNGGVGLQCGPMSCLLVANCVFERNDSDAINTNTSSPGYVIYNNIFANNGMYAINTNTGGLGQFVFCDYNCYYNNTSGSIDINGGTPPGANNVTSNPLFTSVTDGSENYTLQSGSPCKNAGWSPVGY